MKKYVQHRNLGMYIVIVIMSLQIIRFETLRPHTMLYADVVYKSQGARCSGLKEMVTTSHSSSVCTGLHTGWAPLVICACKCVFECAKTKSLDFKIFFVA